MRKVLGVALLGLLCGGAYAADLTIRMDNFTLDGGVAEVVLKVTNTAGRDLRNVIIDCAFLDKEQRAINTGSTIIPLLADGAYAFKKVTAFRSDRAQFADCQVAGGS